MLAFVLAGVLVAASGSDSADLQQNAAQNPPAQTESVSAAIPGIGTVVELKGKATAKSKNGSTRELAEGDAVYVDETLETNIDSTLQIELNDESLFTLSQNTQMSVNDFVYEEGSVKANMGANVVKGVFRYVSGKVEKLNPENVNIEIPSGTIGIRGTIVVGEIEGEKCLVALEPEEGSAVQHRIVISNNIGGQKQEVEITKPGFATMIEGRGQAPKPVYQMAEADMNKFQQKLPQPPKFPEGTKPGTPQRYQNLFDPSKMIERRQAEERHRNPESLEGHPKKEDGGQFKKRGEDELRSDKKEENRKNGPQPPQGPNGNDGSGSGFNGPDQFQKPEGLQKPFADKAQNSGQPQGSFSRPFGGFRSSANNLNQPPPFGSFSPGKNSAQTGFQNPGFNQGQPPSEASGFQPMQASAARGPQQFQPSSFGNTPPVPESFGGGPADPSQGGTFQPGGKILNQAPTAFSKGNFQQGTTAQGSGPVSDMPPPQTFGFQPGPQPPPSTNGGNPGSGSTAPPPPPTTSAGPPKE